MTESLSHMEGGIGLLVLHGLLIRRVGVDGRFGAELLGEGDVLRPWQGQDAFPGVARSTGWQVLESARMAVGRVRTDGVILPLRLTHNVLADLVAARRPTVSTALGELIRDGLLRSVPNGWVLVGEPPGELLELQDVEPCR